jgi:hypothetical protein
MSHDIIIAEGKYYNSRYLGAEKLIFMNNNDLKWPTCISPRELPSSLALSCTRMNEEDPIESYSGLHPRQCWYRAYYVYVRPKHPTSVSYVDLVGPYSYDYDDVGVYVNIKPYHLYHDGTTDINTEYKLCIHAHEGTILYEQIDDFIQSVK